MYWQPFSQALLDVLPCLFVLLVLHFLRAAISSIPLQMLLGVFLALSLLGGIPNFGFEMQSPHTTGLLSFGALSLPVFTLLMLYCELHNTVETQRLMLGLGLSMLFAWLFAILLVNFYSQSVFTLIQAPETLVHFLGDLRQYAFIFVVTHFILLFSLPIIFQALRNLHCRFSLSIFLCNALILMAREMSIVYLFPATAFPGQFQTWLLRFTIILLIAVITAGYRRLLHAPPVSNRQPFSILTSIFRHFQSTDKLRRSMAEWEEKYQTVLNHSSELIMLVNEQGQMINCNLAMFRAFDTHITQVHSISDIIHHADGTPFTLPSAWLRQQSHDLELDKPVMFTHMTLAVPGCPRTFDVDFNLSQTTVDGERIALIIARDMTEQHEQERQKNLLQQELFHAQRLEALGMLAGGVAHDFNNMLHSIQGSADLLRLQPLSAEARALVNTIDTASNRAADLTRQLLGFARRGNFNVVITELGPLVEQAADLFRTTCGNITFKTLIEPEPLVVSCDPVQLQQVIVNLLLNAKDAFDQDAVNPKIVLRAERVRPDTPEWKHRPEDTLSVEHYVCIKVKDNGSGISCEAIEHIFEPFYTTKGTGKGTGMGLAMAYGCITSINGWIDVVSTPGAGSTFSIVIPAADDKHQTPHPDNKH